MVNSKFSTKFLFLLFLLCVVLNPFQVKSAISDNPDAVKALAKCLRATNATMYGTKDCGHCKAQKEMFGQYFRDVRFVDCRSSGAASTECNKARVGKFPQWNFENGRTVVREATLDKIAEVSGCDNYVAQALGGTTENTNQAANNYSPNSVKLSSNNSRPVEETSVSSNTSSTFGSTADLAKCLADKGVKFYGSPKCYHCNKQKEMFEGSFERYLSSNFHNCKGSASEQAECSSKGTFPFPTWYEPSTNKKLVGPERNLETIAKAFNCTLAARNVVQQKVAQSYNSPQQASYSNTKIDNPTDVYAADSFQTAQTQESASSNESKQALISSASSTPYLAEKTLIEQKQNKLAKCIADRNIVLYGVTNAETGNQVHYKATMEQLNEFGNAANQIKVVDCSAGEAECNGILVYPTWILESKKELSGAYDLTNLAQILNCPLE
jgi:arsenate reductase-like glutaredoxin family protein